MAGYIGTTPVPQATQHRESFTATGGQTSFATAGYTPQFIDVYLNGVKLAPADYTATNGSDVVLASGATASDILEIVAYTPFEVANQTFTGTTTAANLTVTGAFTSQGIDDNADAVAITIDSSENVGIGTSSPTQKLDITTAGTTRAFIKNTNLTSSGMYIGEDSTGQQILGSGAYPMRFGTNNTEAMRIDSSGNLLVGTTDASLGTGGIQLNASGRIGASASSLSPMILNRKTSDGTIIDLRKDGSTVGSIESYAGVVTGMTLYPAGNVGIRGATSEIVPYANGSDRDNSVDLGRSSARFQDLYLSGGVYLGGTGSANKLDDYEYGTWTPSMSAYSGSVTSYGEYFKVGDMVAASFSITLDGTADTSAWRIANLPFNWDSSVGGSWGGCITKQNAGLDGHSFQVVTTNDVLIYSSSGATRSYNAIGVNSNIRGVVTYKTT